MAIPTDKKIVADVAKALRREPEPFFVEFANEVWNSSGSFTDDQQDTVDKVAEALKRKPEPTLTDAVYKVHERYGFGWTDTRGIYGSSEDS